MHCKILIATTSLWALKIHMDRAVDTSEQVKECTYFFLMHVYMIVV